MLTRSAVGLVPGSLWFGRRGRISLQESFVLVEAAGGIATLTLNRPEVLNAISDPVADQFMARLDKLSADASIRVIIVTGAGRGFCSGGDIKTMGSGDARSLSQRLAHVRYLHRLPLSLATCPKITIAMINGPAMGAGLGIALACDFRIAAQSARMGAAFVRLAAATDFGVSWHLPRLVGRERARELLLTGEAIDGTTALADGLVSRVAADHELGAVTREFAARFARGPTLAYGHIKRNLDASDRLSLTDMLDLEAITQVGAVESADHREAVRAFGEKRSPVFQGA